MNIPKTIRLDETGTSRCYNSSKCQRPLGELRAVIQIPCVSKHNTNIDPANMNGWLSYSTIALPIYLDLQQQGASPPIKRRCQGSNSGRCVQGRTCSTYWDPAAPHLNPRLFELHTNARGCYECKGGSSWPVSEKILSFFSYELKLNFFPPG